MHAWNEYLSGLSAEKRRLVTDILEYAKQLSAGATEEMPYGVPGLKLNGKPLFAVAAHKEHYGIYPFSPKVIKAARPFLGNLETAMGTIRFKYGTVPSEELIKKLIELRTKEIL